MDDEIARLDNTRLLFKLTAMPLELNIRMYEEFSPEELKEYSQELHSLKLLQNEDDEDINEEEYWRSKRRWIYLPMVIHVEECVPFSKYDEEHTIIAYDDSAHVAKIKYEQFKAIYESLTGIKIRYQDEFKFQKSK